MDNNNKFKIKKRYILFTAYLLIVGLICLSSLVLAKYVSEENQELDFTVGSVLYFNYERSNLERNGEVVQVTPSVYEEDGKNYQLLETTNVVPGDSLTYYFYVSNFNSVTGDQNIVDGVLYPNTSATLSLPIKGDVYDVECTILYRQVPYDETDTTTPDNNAWNNLVAGKYLDLPPVSSQKVKYEFKLSIIVDDQVANTTHEDYFNAVLSVKLFINAASDE